MSTARIVYLHGFASSPGSTKGRALAASFAKRAIRFDQPDLNVPTFETLSIRAMLAVVRERIASSPDPCIVAGSSLGGYVAALLASGADAPLDPRVKALVLLAPAFQIAERWRERSGPAEMRRWRREGTALYAHHARGGVELPLHIGFLDEADEYDPMPRVTLPVTVIQGRRDETVPASLARSWVDRNPQSTLVEVDDDHQLAASIPRIDHELSTMMAALSPRDGESG
jgi:pimeloyl-ACP methyl ester carboxylesterase